MRRARGIKAGLRREDAAIDAMKPFGFPVDLVKSKLKELLKTYGDDGWVFIEEASYKLLIEVILEEIQNDEQGESTTKLITDGDVAESSAAALENVPGSAHLDDPNESQINIVVGQASDAELNKETGDEGESSTELNQEVNGGENAEYAGAAHLPMADNAPLDIATSSGTAHANCIILDAVQRRAQEASGVSNPDKVPSMDYVARQLESSAKTSEFRSAQSCDEPGKRTRKRCHGWFSNSHDEDVIDIRQFISHKQASALPDGTKNRRESRMRWDLKPGAF